MLIGWNKTGKSAGGQSESVQREGRTLNRHRCTNLALFLFAATALCRCSLADAYDPPTGYYNYATGTGTALRTQLNKIIDNFDDPELGNEALPEWIQTSISYDALRSALQVSDADPNDSTKIRVVYNNGVTVTKLTGGSIPGWDNGTTWNREHSWPQSRGLDGTSMPDGSDMHHLFPAKESDNSSRGNLNYGGTYGVSARGRVDGNTKYYPGDADAGLIARAQFYMDVRYDGADSGTNDLVLQSGNPADSGTRMGDLDRLIEWHFAAPPTTFERNRNQIIFTNYQNNRNPFIDHPEYAWSIFVNQTNDSQITIASPTTVDTTTGSSTKTINLPNVIVGGAMPSAQNVTLNKAGNNGTYYSVTTAGLATSSISGSYNAFRTNQTDSKTFSVGLATNTATAGLRTGTVTIDNLDITPGSNGGVGHGANDANDVITVNLNVLDHALPSFTSSAQSLSRTIDFGNIALGDSATPAMIDVFNLNSPSGFTAGLDLDSVASSGNTSAFTTSLATFTNLAAGASQAFTSSFNVAAVGSFLATYTLTLSDENLSGATNKTMTLTLKGIARLAGDFNGDDIVDAGDYIAWKRAYGQPVATAYSGADGNGDFIVNDGDYDVWRAHFGQTAAGFGAGSMSSAAIPEPASITLLAMTAMLICCRSRRRS